MLVSRIIVAAVCLVAAACLASAQGPTIDAKKLVGVWEVVKSSDAPPNATVEFTADGKMIMKVEIKGKMLTMTDAYVVEGNKIVQIVKIAGKETRNPQAVVKLTATELHLKDDKGAVDELKRKAK